MATSSFPRLRLILLAACATSCSQLSHLSFAAWTNAASCTGSFPIWIAPPSATPTYAAQASLSILKKD
jgi:hypothetical protein